MTTTTGAVVDRPETSRTMTQAELAALSPIVDRGRVRQPIAPAPQPMAPRPTTRRRRSWLAGIAGALVLGGFAAAAILTAGTGTEGTAPMGLTEQAWQQYRTGERAGITTVSVTGTGTQGWQDYRAGERAGAATVTGTGTQAWQDYRAGERAGAATVTGTGTQAWQDYRTGERAGSVSITLGDSSNTPWRQYRSGETG
jgi:uncharacterized protein YaiE (UPF0345 family)